MDPDILDCALACLDTVSPRPTNLLGCMLWPGREFRTQQAAGAAVRPVLAELARQGLARRNTQGWVRMKAPNGE